jgi:hypothetical protein
MFFSRRKVKGREWKEMPREREKNDVCIGLGQEMGVGRGRKEG